MPHLLRHGTSVFKVISERPVILPSECHALGEEAITVLGLTRPARAGLKLTTYRLLSESTTTRLRQPVYNVSKLLQRHFCYNGKIYGNERGRCNEG
jgi:hypothetical protein